MLASVTQEKICIAHRRKNKKISVQSLENLKDNKTKKYSSKAQSRTKNAVSALLHAETLGRFGEDWKKQKRKLQIAFVTLTLPAKQMHSDLDLKRHALMQFLKELQRRAGVFSYVWKAERQKNENLHFHVLINKKINFLLVRDLWNNILERLGYIEEYRKKMKKLTLQEYIKQRIYFAKTYSKKNVFTKKDISNYKKAYLEGKNCDWSNPNTTDIHSLKKIISLEKYICKYLRKEQGDKVEGRYWGCSDDLHNAKKFEIYVTKSDLKILQKCKKMFEQKYFIVFSVNLQIIKQLTFFYMFLIFWQNFYCKIHKLHYREPKNLILNN
jgi:hypothetical protein